MAAVVKVGGSLAEYPAALKALCVELQKLAEKHALVAVPGGGRFADAVRELDAQFNLPAEVSHRMAILAMDLYGQVLAQIIPNSGVCDSYMQALRLSQSKRVAVLLPSKLICRDKSLEASWHVTSDSIAAFVAGKMHAPKVVFVTNVDGIFSDNPKTHPNAKLRNEISVGELLSLRVRTSVDSYLPKLLSKTPLDCYVVNGLYPERLGAVLSGQQTVCSKIISEE